MTHRRLAAACLSLLSIFSAGAASAAEPPPDDDRRLAAGETVLRMEPPPAVAGRAAREIAAPADRVARAVGDWRHYAEFFPFVEQSAAALEDGAVVVRQTIAARLLPRRRLVARVEAWHEDDGAGHRVWRFRWRTVGGAPGDGGEWIVRELSPGRARVELRLSGRLGLPAALERRALERTLGWALDGLAQQVRRCRYDLPRHPTCREAPPFAAPAAGGEASQ